MTLKKLRVVAGLKQYKIAEQLGITRQWYTQIESGKEKPDIIKIDKLSKIFKVKPLKILEAWREGRKNYGKRY